MNEELEACCREIWGVLMLATLEVPDNPKLQAAFAKVDARCRATGLMEGVRWVE